MARINKIRYAGWLFLVISVIALSGCATYKAKGSYEEAEQYSAEENYDAAIEKYAEATKLDPSNKKYKLELLSAKTKAATGHVYSARQFAQDGQFEKAIDHYNLAQKFDPSIEVIEEERQAIENYMLAQQLAEEGSTFYAKRNVKLAAKAIEKALKLDPANAKALAVRDLIEKEQYKITMGGIELDVASDEPITLSFKDANIKEVFGILSELSGINFIFDEDIRSQSISVLLEKASFAQAMELIMQMNGLGKKVLNSKTIIIYPESREKAKQYEDQLIQTFYLSHIDAKKAVNLLRTMLQLRKVYVHEERNALVVRDKPEIIRLAEKILDAADRESSEVIFDLELVTISNTDEIEFGPQISPTSVSAGFSKDSTNIVASGLTAGGATTNLIQSLSNLQTFYTLPTANFDLLKRLTDTEILANPRIRVRNKEKAKVHIGSREPVVSVTQNGDNFSDSIQYVDVGVKLDVEPEIQLNRTVTTKLKLEVSSTQNPGTTERGSSFFTVVTTNAETVLTLKDGVQTVIGGLYQLDKNNTRTSIPILGDIPIIGSFFTNYDDEDKKKEILLAITPHIVKQVQIPDEDIASIWSGGEDNLKDGPNFGAFVQPLLSDLEATRPLAAPSVKPLSVTQEIAASDQPVAPAPVVAAQAEPVVSPVAETQKAEVTQESQMETPADEAVPTEIVEPKEELGPPIVLPLPKKSPAMVSFAGPQSAEVGKEFSVAVQVNEVENLYSAPLFVRYDPALLDLVTINEGDFLKQDGETTVFSSSPNRSTGKVIVGYKQGTGGKGATGSGTLFNLVFKPVAAGETKVEASRINFRNPDGVRLEVDSEAVVIEVR